MLLVTCGPYLMVNSVTKVGLGGKSSAAPVVRAALGTTALDLSGAELSALLRSAVAGSVRSVRARAVTYMR